MRSLKLSIIFVLLQVFFISCEDIDEAKPIKKTNIEIEQKKDYVPTAQMVAKRDSFSVQTTFSPEFGWGYQILNWGELFINQPHIPSVQGNGGFENKEKALKTAEYIIYKLNNNLFPPTISPQELDSLGVL